VRQQQIKEIADMLLKRSNPIIIMGDFNSEWFPDDSVVKRFAEKSNLKVYQPDATNLKTYLKGEKRLDWILLSNEFDFVRYEVLPDVISDHQVVVAKIRLAFQIAKE
jgi:endonuclease/exonuclease/phosphatase family metal-dependent hydrolase